MSELPNYHNHVIQQSDGDILQISAKFLAEATAVKITKERNNPLVANMDRKRVFNKGKMEMFFARGN